MATQNLSHSEAIQKLKKLAEDARVCMMTTNLDQRPASARPMYLQEVDDEGSLWFISNKTSDKNVELKNNSKTQLYFMNEGNSEYLSIYGDVQIFTDQPTIDKHWSIMANAWFDGKEDPEVSILKVNAIDVRYWDTKHGKFLDMAMMLYSAVTGDRKNGGVEGKLVV